MKLASYIRRSMDRPWSFLSTHGLALLAIARRPDARLREVAEVVGVTPRAVQSIVNDLVDAGYLERRREGRRNAYRVRGDRVIGDAATSDHVIADLVLALVRGPKVGPRGTGSRHALVLACSDHRYQEPTRTLMASGGLLREAEVVLWPGGAASLTGPEGGLILEVMARAVGAEPPARVVLVAHQDCHVPGAFTSNGDPFESARAVTARRRRTIDLVHEAFGVRPEIWYLTERGASRVGSRPVVRDEEMEERAATAATG
jgi:DNA-binding transcriptional ArsR family regulator